MYYKQIFRELKAHKARYITIMIILAMALTLAVGNIMSSNSIKDQMAEYFDTYYAEDGEFKTYFELSDDTINDLKNMGVKTEPKFYADYEYGDTATVRAYRNRDSINTLNVMEGSLPSKDNEVFVENKFAAANRLSVGDLMKIAELEFKISGIGTAPDYVSVKKNMTDLKANDADFGLLFLTSSGYDKLFDTKKSIQNEVYEYAYTTDNDVALSKIKAFLNDVEIPKPYNMSNLDSALISITSRADNERMTSYAADLDTTLSISILMAVLLAVLIAFIISVFMTHTIDEQSAQIGTLYALGIRRREMMKQYVLLPVAVIFLGGVIGIIAGYLLCGVSTANNAANYSYPEISSTFYPIALLYGIVLPTLFGYLINHIIISRKLKSEPLSLLRKTRKSLKPSKVKIKSKNFNRIYRIRQFLREKVVYIVLFVGCFYSLCILVFAFTMFSGLNNYVESCTKDVKWSYMYTLNSMPTDHAGEEDAEQAVMKSVSAYNTYAEKNLNLSLLGIDKDSKYFDFDADCGKDEIIVSDCAAKKFNWAKGDEIELVNNKDDSVNKFKIKNVVEYSASLLVFMPKDNVRSIYGFNEDFYNVLLSDKQLDKLDIKYVQNLTRRSDIEAAAHTLMDNMQVTIIVSLGGAIVIFVAVLYLLLKHVIDKSSFALSLMRIFGYRDKEVDRIFVNSNFIIVVIAALLAILVGKPYIDSIYPTFITDIDLGLSYSFKPVIYLLIIAIILVSYLASTLMLKYKLKKIDYTQVLKERD